MTKLIILGGIIFLILMVCIAFFSLYGNRFFAPIKGETDRITIVNQGQYRIQGYEMFYDIHEDVKEIDVLLESIDTADSQRETIRCEGWVARRAKLVGDYNSASMSWQTTGQWKADNLPLLLEHKIIKDCN